ncbi:AGE family epimerase/isomerase [Brevundimonas sp. SORGH_AS_0993]|uniref:AGE family epimerase/isomerase n=1 Tax=Brevundimonas sp. SORGH_AS_0993 TaxID=3041794 RepID=UPI0027899877|nr:AGE family epimerase/isomerase [Brevundimonas sp. SORGH_AS_0993]MDQ1154925.1 mannose/cellobiose epimerase-like protein (N-acyl-D-glucosamine 2-epimerase family) [Brevundimonas sp. SORGH_AS_0993]
MKPCRLALPRRQNPHMHMLEALLAWQATAPDPAFEAAARSLLALARDRLIVDGAVREYFTADWSPDPATGRVIEPGHLEEWAWLLTLAAGLGLDDGSAAHGLHRQATTHGRHDGFLIRETGPDGATLDAGRRLWAQTEAIRTGFALGDPETPALIARTFETHLATEIPGLWIDSYEADGRSPDRAAPASSFYHLMTAFSELLRSEA